MDDHPLDGCRLKIAQAVEDFDDLHAEIIAFAKANPYPLTVEDESESGEQVLKVGEPVVLPPKWGLHVGLIAYSARSALEYLVYELAAKAGGDPERDRTQFPIATDRDDYLMPKGREKRSFRDRCLMGIPEPIRKKIDDIQPYNKVGGPERDPLAILAVLANRDKHRTLSPAYGAIKTGKFVVSPTGPVSWRDIEIRIDGGREIHVKAEMKMSRRPSRDIGILTVDPQMDMPGEIGAEIVFQCDDRLIPLHQVKAAVRHVAGIIRWLEPDLDAL